MYVRATLLVLVVALLSACQMIVTPPEPAPEEHKLDRPITLAVGESATLEDDVLDSTLEITFVGVREDTRCPDSRTSNVMCAWAGAVEVEMTAVVNDQTETFRLAGITDYDGVVEGSIVSETDSTIWYFAGYHFVLEKVVPYPGDERPKPEEYVATVIVRRAAEPLPTPTETTASIEHLIDETGLPLLCVSEMAMARWAAGDSESEPAQLTPPLAEETLSDVETADEICAIVFGEEWRIADNMDIDGMWSIALPKEAGYWVWDYEANGVVES